MSVFPEDGKMILNDKMQTTTPRTEHQLWGVPAISSSDLDDPVTPAWLCPTGASWRSRARWRCPSPPASSRCSPTTPPPPCSPSSWRTPAGWSRSCPTSSFCTGEQSWVDGEGRGQEAAMGETRRREQEEIQLAMWHEAVIKLSGKVFSTSRLTAARPLRDPSHSSLPQQTNGLVYVPPPLQFLSDVWNVPLLCFASKKPFAALCLEALIRGKKKENTFCFSASRSTCSQPSTKTASLG